ncbi:MAG TPA: helix-turn-helix domain-containing protein [Anaerolineales bacterium]|jgi:DNA-binding HxlR family transcriptional regulator|nr:helix-turn-helix domain-containing protein [Anaerolineales bacterium]
MNKYGQYCPTARAVEILGDRWTLLIVRDLLLGAQHFNELERGLPGIPKALLAERLRRLQQVGAVERLSESGGRKSRYQLTPAGWELYPIIDSLTRWGAKWAFGEPEPAELNPVLLLWWMRDRVNPERLPEHRVVVEFNFRETRPKRFWLVLDPGDVSVCVKHPGFDIDILIQAELAALYEVWYGRITFARAIREERLEIDSTPALIHAFPKWFALSPVAGLVRAVD